MFRGKKNLDKIAAQKNHKKIIGIKVANTQQTKIKASRMQLNTEIL
jgi:hypothetical protein